MSSKSSEEKIDSVFFPYASYKIADLTSRNERFVHYTSAEVAVTIIRRREVWMRNATTMNDFMEIEYGVGCLCSAWHSDPGTNFKLALDKIYPNLSSEVAKRFDEWLPCYRSETYLTCISEHLDT